MSTAPERTTHTARKPRCHRGGTAPVSVRALRSASAEPCPATPGTAPGGGGPLAAAPRACRSVSAAKRLPGPPSGVVRRLPGRGKQGMYMIERIGRRCHQPIDIVHRVDCASSPGQRARPPRQAQRARLALMVSLSSSDVVGAGAAVAADAPGLGAGSECVTLEVFRFSAPTLRKVPLLAPVALAISRLLFPLAFSRLTSASRALPPGPAPPGDAPGGMGLPAAMVVPPGGFLRLPASRSTTARLRRTRR
jgi:hypothetical protein